MTDIYENSLYFLGTGALILSGIVLKITAPLGIGIFLLYSGYQSHSSTGESSEKKAKYIKLDLLWNLFFLGISFITYFSLIKVIINIFLGNQILIWNKIIIFISLGGVMYFEILFRISLQKKNRFAAIMLLIILVASIGAFILGGHWFKTDLFLGFLSLTVTVIISFRKAYLGLSDILS